MGYKDKKIDYQLSHYLAVLNNICVMVSDNNRPQFHKGISALTTEELRELCNAMKFASVAFGYWVGATCAEIEKRGLDWEI